MADCACRVLGCEKALMWMIDDVRREAWTRSPGAGGKLTEIRVPLTEGFLASCVTSQVPEVIADPHSDSRFYKGAGSHPG